MYVCTFLELAKLDKTERRYAWIKRRMRTNEEIWKIFPPSWHVPYRLCIQFCKKTRYGTFHYRKHRFDKIHSKVKKSALEKNQHMQIFINLCFQYTGTRKRIMDCAFTAVSIRKRFSILSSVFLTFHLYVWECCFFVEWS